jgi:cysteine desulfurase
MSETPAGAYFDHAAAAPLLPEAREAMLPFLGAEFGNPSSLHHHGHRPKQAIEQARERAAALVNADPREVIFTASASESNNHALKGLVLARRDKGRHIIISAAEHLSVSEPARQLGKQGCEVTVLGVDREGRVSPDELGQAIRPDTALVSVTHASSDVGTIQDIAALARIAREHKVPFLSDGTAAIGRIPVDVKALGLDAYSFPAQSVYGPKGAAALWLRRGIRVPPLIAGGFQENNRRAGTENVAAITGFGAAAEVTSRELAGWSEKMARLGSRIRAELPPKLERLVFTGSADRLPGHVSLCVEFVEGEAMLLFLDDSGIAAASGSSCAARSLKVAPMLLAMGLPHALAQSSLVLTLGKDSTDAEVDHFLASLPPIVERLRQMSPLYAKFRRGEDPYEVKPGDACDEHHDETEEES